MLTDILKELIEGGYVGQAVIATIVTAGIVFMWVRQIPVPPEMYAVWGVIVGWYFRSQAQFVADQKARRN